VMNAGCRGGLSMGTGESANKFNGNLNHYLSENGELNKL